MKLLSKTLLFLIVLFLFDNIAYSLSEYQIREICRKKPSRITCIKKFKSKKLKILKGNKIEIPVIPFKK